MSQKIVPLNDPSCVKCQEFQLLGDSHKFFEQVIENTYVEEGTLFIDATKAYDFALNLYSAGFTDVLQIAYWDDPKFADIRTANDHEACHVQHVPLGKPGLVLNMNATIRATGEKCLISSLVDGTHRANRHLLEKKHFHVFYLNVEQSLPFIFRSQLKLLESQLIVVQLGENTLGVDWNKAFDIFGTDNKTKITLALSHLLEEDKRVAAKL